MLLTWLQSTLSTSILSCVLRMHTLLWGLGENSWVFSQANVIWTQLRVTALKGKSMREFLSQIGAIFDSLASVGCPIMLQEHVDSILERLSSDYHPIIAMIEPQPTEQVKALFLALLLTITNTQTLVKILLFLQLFLKHIKHKTLGTFIAPTHLWLMLIMAKPLDVYLYPITIWYSHLLPLIQHETPIITH